MPLASLFFFKTLVSRSLLPLALAFSGTAQTVVDEKDAVVAVEADVIADQPAATDASREPASIQVKPVVEIDGLNTEVSLRDLMAARGLKSSTAEELGKVRLADAPRPGETRTFTGAGLEQVFRKHLRDLEGDAGAKIVLRIPSRVTVSRKTFRLRPEEVKSAVIRELQVSCADCEFQIANLVVPLVMTDIPHGASWSVRMRPEMPKGSFSLPLEVINPDGGRRTYWISGLLTISKKVPVASRTLAIGEHLRAEDYSLQNKDVTFATDVSPSENEMKTSTVSRSVSAGQVIWRSFLRREQLVKMGDAVRVVAGADEWQVSIEGIAQGGGYAGDSVKVKIPRTQKIITGQLTDAGTVEVRQ